MQNHCELLLDSTKKLRNLVILLKFFMTYLDLKKIDWHFDDALYSLKVT